MSTTFKLLSAFRTDVRASVAIIFGIAMLPIMVAGAVAVEYTNLNRAHTELQALSDAAALAAAGAYANGNAEYQQVAVAYMQENQNGGALDGLTISPVVTANDAASTMTVQSEVNVPATLGTILGQEYSAVDVRSTVSLPVFSDHYKGEIVLVMDYSGSMTEYVNGKMKYQTLRDEVVKLIDSLSQDGSNTDVKIGLVPFSTMVRVSMPKKYYNGYTTTATYTRCVEDRKYPYNEQASTPVTSSANHTTKFYDAGSCSTSMGARNLTVRDLSTDHSATISAIQSMQPYNLTHIALGMEWGYHLLDSRAPYTSAVNFGDPDTLKAVVLLTDGRQTADGWGPGNHSWDRSPEQAENRLEQLCENMKADGIRVVTVSFDLNDLGESETEQRLANCAGDINAPTGTYYFNANSNDELAEAFGVIKDQLAKTMYLSE